MVGASVSGGRADGDEPEVPAPQAPAGQFAPAREQTVTVRRQWNDWRRAQYRLDGVEGVHWSKMSGGVRASAPRRFLAGYVRCDRAVAGEVAHSGAHGPCPHRIKVVILKKDNPTEVYRRLVVQATERPSA